MSAQEGRTFADQPAQPQPSYSDPSSVFSQPSSNQPAASLNPFGDPAQNQYGYSRGQSELQKLRNEYTQIAQSKAALMTAEELKAAVAVAREETSELRAKKELAALVGNLSKLIEKYPQSKAAKEARKLLRKPEINPLPKLEDFDGEPDSQPRSEPAAEEFRDSTE